MKILTTKNVKKSEAIGRENIPANVSEETSLEIPTITVAGLGALLTLILTFASTASTILKDWAVGVPKERIEIEMKEDDIKLKVLKQALQNKNPQDRANSLKLLINAGLLKDSNGELMKQASNPEQLPLWEQTSIPSPSASPTVSPSATVTPKPTASATAAN